MLVLARKREQVIYIGDDITVKVLSVRGDKVKLGINAPQYVRVDREEVRSEVYRTIWGEIPANRDARQ